MIFKTNRRTAMFAGVAALAGLAGAGIAWKRHAPRALAPDAMQALWSSEFTMPSGESLLMSSLKGRPLVLNFWATWCPPCVEEMPLIDAFFRQNKQYGWQVVGLAIDQPSRVKQFLNQFPVDYSIGLAGLNGTELGKMLGNEQSSLPFTVVLDGQGALLQRKLGKLTPEDIKNWTI
ncbi:redoxin [Limnohabitans sp. Rim8]|jgi:thiol-disulfide isomerase/thioredoxin|uniref:Redoxin n=1 Tax=Limnohabitans curvus TaxID=323423 RepID=A0A315EPC7_9BURK|nr:MULTISPECIES: TlpA disulfide reductase family protein [Limnohabitans]PUE56648.1 redoxin [Limnohabitans sp. Rim8]PUE59776.1 redoxin [Limnohabitans curvus]